MNAPTTHREALLAELLDDIGRIQERIDTVPDALGAKLEPIEQRVERLTRAMTISAQNLVEAGNVHQARIAEYVEKVAAEQVTASAERAAAQAVTAVREEQDRAITAIREATTEQRPVATAPQAPAGHRTTLAALIGLVIGVAIGYLVATT
jgi:small-conductance mechanosensitive channel